MIDDFLVNNGIEVAGASGPAKWSGVSSRLCKVYSGTRLKLRDGLILYITFFFRYAFY